MVHRSFVNNLYNKMKTQNLVDALNLHFVGSRVFREIDEVMGH